MKVAVIQMEVGDSSKNNKLKKACKLLDGVKGADLILLPELWNIGFFSFDRYKAESETENDKTLSAMRNKAAQLGAYIYTGSIVERDGERLYNSAYLCDRDGNLAGKYRKIHLFGYDSEENKILTPGTDIVTVSTDFGIVGLSTCYDLRFPELYRRQLEQGVQIFLITSAWPYARLDHWLMFNRVRALENLAYLISSNASGINRGVEFAGNSGVVNPWGQDIERADKSECILEVDINLHEVEDARSNFPAVKDRVLKI